MVYLAAYLCLGLIYLLLPYTQSEINKAYLGNSEITQLPEKAKIAAYWAGYVITVLAFPLLIIGSILSASLQFALVQSSRLK